MAVMVMMRRRRRIPKIVHTAHTLLFAVFPVAKVPVGGTTLCKYLFLEAMLSLLLGFCSQVLQFSRTW